MLLQGDVTIFLGDSHGANNSDYLLIVGGKGIESMTEILSQGDIVGNSKQNTSEYRVRRILESHAPLITYLAEDMSGVYQYSLTRIHDPLIVALLSADDFQVLRDVEHPYIGQVYDIRTEDNSPYHLKLEYAEGPSLLELSEEFPWTVERVMELARQMLDALEYLSEQSVCHCGVRPENIFLSPNGPRLVNLGLARLMRRTGLYEAERVSLYHPLDMEHDEDWRPAADLYSLLVVLFEALTGQLPFEEQDGFPQRGKFADVDDFNLQPQTRAIADILIEALHSGQRQSSPKEFKAKLLTASTVHLEPLEGKWLENPFVRYLQSIYRNSRVGNAENRGLDSDFSEKTYVPTSLDEKLIPDILACKYWLVLLTGNPGDGKTAFLDKVGKYLMNAGANAEECDLSNGWHYTLFGQHFIANFDASESSSGKRANEILDNILEHLSGSDPPQVDPYRTVFIAINDGKLRDYFLFKDRYGWLGDQIDQLLEGDANRADERIVLVDLKARCLSATSEAATAPSLFEQILNRFLDDRFWRCCNNCCARSACYIKFNRDTLADPKHGATVGRRLTLLFRLTHLRGTHHSTIRDVRSALSYIIAGVSSCDEVHKEIQSGFLPAGWYNRLYFMAVFNPKQEIDAELEAMATYDPATVSNPRLDRFFHYNRQVDEKCRLDELCYSFSARAEHLSSCLVHPSMERDWHRAMKRRFYFEGNAEELSNHQLELPDYITLLPYRYADLFIRVLEGESSLEEVRSWICEAISRSDGIVEEKVYSGYLCVRTNYNEEQELAVFKRFPVSEFRCEIAQSVDARFTEYSPNTFHFLYNDRDAILNIHLDLFEILMRLRDGYMIGSNEQAALVIDMAQFKSRLLRQETAEIILLESGRKIHRITQKDGGIHRADF